MNLQPRIVKLETTSRMQTKTLVVRITQFDFAAEDATGARVQKVVCRETLHDCRMNPLKH